MGAEEILRRRQTPPEIIEAALKGHDRDLGLYSSRKAGTEDLMILKTLSDAELSDRDASVSNSTDFITFDLAQVAPRLQIWKTRTCSASAAYSHLTPYRAPHDIGSQLHAHSFSALFALCIALNWNLTIKPHLTRISFRGESSLDGRS